MRHPTPTDPSRRSTQPTSADMLEAVAGSVMELVRKLSLLLGPFQPPATLSGGLLGCQWLTMGHSRASCHRGARSRG